MFNVGRAILNYKEMLYFEKYGEIEMHLVRYLADRSREAIDVGANTGGYIHFMLKFAKRVHAFEPIPEFQADLLRKFAGRIQLWPIGLSDESARIELAIPRINGQLVHGCATVSPIAAKAYPAVEPVEINLDALDDVYYGDVGFMKIDVEGHEMKVLEGAASTIQKCQPRVLVEIDEHLNPGGLRAAEVLFSALRYQGFFVHNFRLRPMDEFNPAIYQNPANRVDLTADLKHRTDNGEYISNFIFLPLRDPPSLLGKLQKELGWQMARRLP